MKTYDFEQGSGDWLAWRKSGIGASDIAAVMGVSPFKSAHQLWLEKTGQSEGFKGNAATARGSALEDEARHAFAKMNDEDVATTNTCLSSTDYPFILASLDGWIDDETIIEIKCPMEKSFNAMKDVIPEHYQLQMQQQMLVSGATSCVFWVYHPELGNYAHGVKEDKLQQEYIIAAATEFWDKVELMHWQSNGINDCISELSTLKSIEIAAIESRKIAEKALLEAMQKEDIKQAATDTFKVTVVNRKVVDKEACALNADWVVASKMFGEGKADMADIEKDYKKDGASYIKLTAI